MNYVILYQIYMRHNRNETYYNFIFACWLRLLYRVFNFFHALVPFSFDSYLLIHLCNSGKASYIQLCCFFILFINFPYFDYFYLLLLRNRYVYLCVFLFICVIGIVILLLLLFFLMFFFFSFTFSLFIIYLCFILWKKTIITFF